MELPTLTLVRHGATEWSAAGRHTSVTDLPLLPEGEQTARALAPRLAGLHPALVLTSPRLRSRRTAELSGFGDAVVDPDLAEWDYGDFEGITTAEIRRQVPGWTVWSHPCPGGETAQQIADRTDRVIARVREVAGPVLVFGHGHALRVLAARWLGLGADGGRLLRLDTATLSTLGWEHETAAVLRWNA